MKATAGFLGKITPQVDMKAAVSYFRFDTVAPILAEATRNRASRVPVNPGASLNISDDMGFEINANIGWSPVPAFRIQPFVSVFVPLDGTTREARPGRLLVCRSKRRVAEGCREIRSLR
jgi:hypothetical protein